MIKLDLSGMVKNLDGTDGGVTLGKELAAHLCGKLGGIDPIKAYDWAVKLQNKGFIDLDRADCENLIQEIKKYEGLTNIWKAQLILKIQECLSKEK